MAQAKVDLVITLQTIFPKKLNKSETSTTPFSHSHTLLTQNWLQTVLKKIKYPSPEPTLLKIYVSNLIGQQSKEPIHPAPMKKCSPDAKQDRQIEETPSKLRGNRRNVTKRIASIKTARGKECQPVGDDITTKTFFG